MAIIDAHVHLYPPELNRDPAAWAAARQEPHWAELCLRRRKDGRPVQEFPSVERLLDRMDEAGVTRAVLQGWYWENHATCREHNRFYAACLDAYPKRFSAFASVHPGAGEAALDEVRWAKAAGFVGLGELSPHSQHVPLHDPIWRKILTLAGELQLPVNLHVTDPASRAYPGRVETPLTDFLALAREFPETTFILAHWGGGLAWSEEAAALTNLWFDTAASPLLYGTDVWRREPSSRVLFGSDYPLVLYPKVAGAAAEMAGILGEAQAAGAATDIFHANAAWVLALP
ncbi:Amidohydrolase [Lacunisphaera limnophila]|uniref:Amidohydrolase n=1 Tax=Lacunisphaera limnophila TaxID=1838286 RepID=A0A1D8AYB3_9BACT|nr:TatD family hydrolase [Lacunisphaera limnophila]AOS45854.1 Amidohydrolase [Lacunisphaera limnophila]